MELSSSSCSSKIFQFSKFPKQLCSTYIHAESTTTNTNTLTTNFLTRRMGGTFVPNKYHIYINEIDLYIYIFLDDMYIYIICILYIYIFNFIYAYHVHIYIHIYIYSTHILCITCVLVYSMYLTFGRWRFSHHKFKNSMTETEAEEGGETEEEWIFLRWVVVLGKVAVIRRWWWEMGRSSWNMCFCLYHVFICSDTFVLIIVSGIHPDWSTTY